MSRWLRRGFGQSNTSQTDDRQPPSQNSEFPSPPRNDMPSTTAGVYQQQQQQPQAMGGYDAVAVSMDVDQRHMNKYSQPPASYQAPSTKAYDRVARMMPEEHGRRPSSSRDQRRSTRPVAASTYLTPSSSRPSGATSAPMNHHHQHPGGHYAPPPQTSHYRDPLLGSATPPDASMQPNYPPAAVTADSPQPSEASQRRPAYLLHRDLVIGKGSYGQVCIASRGEPEGHSTGRSGKRKKFACKCVMLRNDPKYIAKLQEEVNVLRELRGHDNVIRLYDVFCVDNELFIITELGRGGDLFHLLTTHPKHGVTESYAGAFGKKNRFNELKFQSLSSLSHSCFFSQDGFRDAICRGFPALQEHLSS